MLTKTTNPLTSTPEPLTALAQVLLLIIRFWSDEGLNYALTLRDETICEGKIVHLKASIRRGEGKADAGAEGGVGSQWKTTVKLAIRR